MESCGEVLGSSSSTSAIVSSSAAPSFGKRKSKRLRAERGGEGGKGGVGEGGRGVGWGGVWSRHVGCTCERRRYAQAGILGRMRAHGRTSKKRAETTFLVRSGRNLSCGPIPVSNGCGGFKELAASRATARTNQEERLARPRERDADSGKSWQDKELAATMN